MAVTARDPRANLLWTRLHFLLRAIGLLGALAALVGLIWVAPAPEQFSSIDDVRELLSPQSPVYIGAMLLAVGGAAALAVLLLELLIALAGAAGRRSALGAQAVFQVLLALALLVGVNLWSFSHFRRIDCTRDGRFTLPADLREQLEKLRETRGDGATQVIVYQRHKAFAAAGDKPDRYDYAAERKVVEKIKDLVDLLRDFDARLRVEVLDVEDDRYEERLKRLTADAPALRQAIERAAENSIFIAQGKGDQARVQQLSFHELYQLDKVASKEHRGGQGNLVLLGQGADGRGTYPFVRRILRLEARKPRVGVLVAHRLLTTEGGAENYTLAGLRKALEVNGLEVRDIVVKRGQDAAADTFDESKLDRLDSELEDAGAAIRVNEARATGLEKAIKDLAGATTVARVEALADSLRQLGLAQIALVLDLDPKLDDEDRAEIREVLTRQLAQARDAVEQRREEQRRLRQEREKLDVDRLAESKRLTDVKAKLSYLVQDCDLLLVVRLTRRSNGDFILPRLHRMTKEQVDCVRDFLKAGKPVLACLGPTTEPPLPLLASMMGVPPQGMGQFLQSLGSWGPAGADDLEDLLGSLGFRLSEQTVLFDADARRSEGQSDLLPPEGSEKPPPVDFDSPTSDADPRRRAGRSARPEAPLRRGLRVTARGVGPDFDLRLRFPRPVYFERPDGSASLGALSGPAFRGLPAKALAPRGGAALGALAGPTGRQALPGWYAAAPGRGPAYDPVFLITATGWNDDQPFATATRRPRFTPPGPDDPVREALDQPRRGSFAVAAGAEVAVPGGEPARVVVIGQGDVFTGPTLGPARERLLLQTAQWLLGRDEYLPTDDHPWTYPRLGLTEDEVEHRQWLWGARLGMPLLFAVLGLVVMLSRRLR